MSLINENMSIKIKDVCHMTWDASEVKVAPRAVHALVYRDKGRGSYRCRGKSSATSKGDVFYMPANCGYSACYEEANEVYAFHFESDCASLMENFVCCRAESVGYLFKKARELWCNRGPGYYFEVMSIFCEILKSISEDALRENQRRYPPSFMEAVTYMEKNFTNADTDVAGLVDMAHMSNTYFRRLFVEKYGTTPVKHLLTMRLNHAERLLAEGRYSVERVAELSGFSDAKYFSRIAKRVYGVSPSKLYKFTGGNKGGNPDE